MLLTILLVYALILVGVGLYNRHSPDAPTYHIAGRKVGVGGIFAGTFTLMGAGEFVTMTALTYDIGVAALLLFVGFALGTTTLAIFAKKIRAHGENQDMHSLPDFIAYHCGATAGRIATVLCVLSLTGLLMLQFVVGGLMIQTMTSLSYMFCVIIMAAVVLSYIALGGLKTVLATDKIQTIFMAIFALIFLFIVRSDGTTNTFHHVSLPEVSDVLLGLNFTLFGFMGAIGGGDVWQRLMMGKDDKTTQKGMLLSGIGILAFGVFIYVLAIVIKTTHPDIDPNDAFTVFLSSMPDHIAWVMLLIIFSVILSTADAELFAISILLHKEMNRQKGKEMTIQTTRKLVLIVTVTATIIAIAYRDIIDIYMMLLYLFGITGSATLPLLFNRGTQRSIVSALLSASALLIVLLATGQMDGPLQFLIFLPGALCFFFKHSDNPSLVQNA